MWTGDAATQSDAPVGALIRTPPTNGVLWRYAASRATEHEASVSMPAVFVVEYGGKLYIVGGDADRPSATLRVYRKEVSAAELAAAVANGYVYLDTPDFPYNAWTGSAGSVTPITVRNADVVALYAGNFPSVTQSTLEGTIHRLPNGDGAVIGFRSSRLTTVVVLDVATSTHLLYDSMCEVVRVSTYEYRANRADHQLSFLRSLGANKAVARDAGGVALVPVSVTQQGTPANWGTTEWDYHQAFGLQAPDSVMYLSRHNDKGRLALAVADATGALSIRHLEYTAGAAPVGNGYYAVPVMPSGGVAAAQSVPDSAHIPRPTDAAVYPAVPDGVVSVIQAMYPRGSSPATAPLQLVAIRNGELTLAADPVVARYPGADIAGVTACGYVFHDDTLLRVAYRQSPVEYSAWVGPLGGPYTPVDVSALADALNPDDDGGWLNARYGAVPVGADAIAVSAHYPHSAPRKGFILVDAEGASVVRFDAPNSDDGDTPEAVVVTGAKEVAQGVYDVHVTVLYPGTDPAKYLACRVQKRSQLWTLHSTELVEVEQ